MKCRWVAVAIWLSLQVLGGGAANAQPKSETATERKATPVPWAKLSSAERQVLKPLERDWNQLPGLQQRRLIDSAKQYPKLAPIQQERFQERIKEWAALTPEQRKLAREKYRNLSTLPPEKQYQIREKWSAKKAPAPVEPAAPAPEQPK